MKVITKLRGTEVYTHKTNKLAEEERRTAGMQHCQLSHAETQNEGVDPGQIKISQAYAQHSYHRRWH